MEWKIVFHNRFDDEFDGLSEAMQDAILATANLPAKNRLGSEATPGGRLEFVRSRKHEETEMLCL